jgi:hypothetical protein
VKVSCKPAWLLHFGAAPLLPEALYFRACVAAIGISWSRLEGVVTVALMARVQVSVWL